MLFVREDAPCKLLPLENYPMETFCEQGNLRKTSWLLYWSYNPIKCKINFHLENMNRSLALHSPRYKNLFIIGDLNVEASIVLYQFLAILT